MTRRALTIFASLALVAAGCGGKVVVDQAGSGTTTGNVGGSGGADCAALQGRVEATVAAAVTCYPNVSADQCSGVSVVSDACGCPHVANATTPDAVIAASDAYDAWSNSACPVPPCTPCTSLGNGAYCDSGSWQCVSVWVD